MVTGVSLGRTYITATSISNSSVNSRIEVIVGPDLSIDGSIAIGDKDPSITISITVDTFTAAVTDLGNWDMSVIGEEGPPQPLETIGINNVTITMEESPGAAKEICVTFHGTITGKGTLLMAANGSVYSQGFGSSVLQLQIKEGSSEDLDFVPGEGGEITFNPFAAEANKIGGLYIEKNHEYYPFIFGGSPIYYHYVEMKFIPAEQFGATGYKLQYSEDSGDTWKDSDITINATQDNVIVEDPSTTTIYRLVVIGGDKANYTSNEVTADIPEIKTEFRGNFLDESMFVSGVMAPWVGRGLEASFTAEKQNYPEPNTVSEDVYMTYQWYRVNPVSFEMTAIEGATDLTYTTTEDDVGYKLMIRATGDDENISGFVQVMSNFGVLKQNNACISNVTSTGFTLNLYKTVPGITANELSLIDYNGDPVIDDGASPFFFWETHDGYFVDASEDYKTVKFISNPGMEGEMVEVKAFIGDDLGHTNEYTIELEGKSLLSGDGIDLKIVSDFSDVNGGNIYEIEYSAKQTNDGKLIPGTSVDIFYTLDGKGWTQIADGLLDKSSFKWQVPDIKSSFAKIKIVAQNGTKIKTIETSMFEILPPYYIEGRVLDLNNSGVPSITVKCSEIETITDDSGYYIIRGLEKGSYVVNVVAENRLFVKSSVNVNLDEYNYSTYKIFRVK